MDRQQMINKLEQARAGNQVCFEQYVSLSVKNNRIYKGIEEIPLDRLSYYRNAVWIVIMEGKNDALAKKINELVSPHLIITEVRHDS